MVPCYLCHFTFLCRNISSASGWAIIIWLVVGGVACLEDKWVVVVGSEKMCGSIIEVAFMAVKEEDLGGDLASSTGPTEETH